MKLTKKNETSSKITFTYDKPAGQVEGYTYFADGQRVSKTMNADDLEVTFGKVASGKYAVEAVGFDTIAKAEWPEVIVEPEPEPEPTPPGTVFFRGNFETGNFSQWLYVAAENTGYPDHGGANHGLANIVTDPVASGRYAMRIDLQPDTTRPSRVDAVAPNYTITLGQDLYWTTEFWLPSNWSRPSPFPNWYVIGQYIAQQPSLVAGTSFYINQDSLRFIIQTGQAVEGKGATYNNGGAPSGGVPVTFAIPSPEMNLETWHQLILRVKPAVDSSGVFQVWWRRRGETDWTQTVNLTGFPSLHWSSTGTPNPPMSCRDFCDAYRQPTNAPSTIYHDNFCRASTFAAAESCFTNTTP